ncbi:MAG: hypothetical protein M3R00_05675, partial [Pseudomonadota bacterium]|nr:hypothetical protein [Pseudomonadota bacterium]
VFHCKNDKLHDIALMVTRQLLDINVLHPLGQLHQQEIIIKLIYLDEINIVATKIDSPNDLNRLANIIIDTYTLVVGSELLSESDMKVNGFMVSNRVKFRELLQIIHARFVESGYLKAA